MSDQEAAAPRQVSISSFAPDPRLARDGVPFEPGPVAPNGEPMRLFVRFVGRYDVEWLDAQERHSADLRQRVQLTARDRLLIDQRCFFDVALCRPWENVFVDWPNREGVQGYLGFDMK